MSSRSGRIYGFACLTSTHSRGLSAWWVDSMIHAVDNKKDCLNTSIDTKLNLQ